MKSNKKVLVLRTCDEDMSSKNGFKWPVKGPVKCTDWLPTNECGNGLQGFLYGEGDGNLASWADKAKWLVVSVSEADIVNLDGKVKFPKGNVVFCGNRFDATQYIAAKAPNNVKAIIGYTSVSGDKGVSTSGRYGTSTSGVGGKLVITWHDCNRYRLAIGYVGEGGILPNVAYRLDDKGNFVKKV